MDETESDQIRRDTRAAMACAQYMLCTMHLEIPKSFTVSTSAFAYGSFDLIYEVAVDCRPLLSNK